MRRRALLASAAAASTASVAGCPTPPWTDDPTEIDGADVTFRREHDGEIDAPGGGNDVAEVRRRLNEDPPRLVVAGSLLDGPRSCYRVTLFEAALDEGTLRLRIVAEDDPDSDVDRCSDVAEPHPYSVAVAFPETPVPERVVVRHGDEAVLEETV
ncbi:hypothetical protein DVK05_06315 [Halorubrum sp. Atlit-8R]|uniref:hypothetical protein n=1 Tax=unclassified Halorubrum TaxID=2642239 RepID=UPI000EF189C4|nr:MULTISPECIES: hypothetical protein [unclassified Halorubrum]RLM66844.1 hypothetical protein DVK08_13335 [Halorubrum sp. Atlit-9R]RLM81667.1 hypothetical protein DVK05_06315 [Halorubrum sp. Atlit-8R]